MVNAVGKIIAAFLMLIVGLSLITVVASQTNSLNDLTSRTDTISIAPARLAGGVLNTTYPFVLTNTGVGTWKFDNSECIPQTIVFKNSTGGIQAEGTGYEYTPSTATLTLYNVVTLNYSSSNTTTAEFAYCPNDYMALSWGRTALDTSIGLFALGLMIGAVALTLSVFRDYEII